MQSGDEISPLFVWISLHDRRAVRGLVTGALLIAGYFTLIPNWMLGDWLWG